MLEPWPAERFRRLPISLVDPQLLVIPLHDVDLEHVARLRAGTALPAADPVVHVDARSGEFRVVDGRHRALLALWRDELVAARVLTLAHQP